MTGIGNAATLKLALERLDETASGSALDTTVHALAEIRRLVAEVLMDIETPKDGDRRRDMRMAQTAISTVRKDGALVDCVITDLSVGGALIDADADLEIQSEIEVDVPRAGPVRARVIGRSPEGLHIAFLDPTEAQRKAILDGFTALLWK
jgi:plasmid stabilization system protein ParE